MSFQSGLVVMSVSGRISQLSGYSDNKSVKIKGSNNSPIKHPIFISLSGIARTNGDKYWEDLFIDCAKNNFPRDFRFDRRNLQFKVKNKSLSINLFPIPDISLEEKYVMVKQFIMDHSALISMKESNLLQNSFGTHSNMNSPSINNSHLGKIPKNHSFSSESSFSFENTAPRKDLIWSNISSNNIQIMFLEVYCKMKSEEYHFDEQQTDLFLQSIILAVFTKDISPADIEMKNGVIQNINSVYVDSNGFLIKYIPIKIKNKKLDPIIETKSPLIHILSCSKALGYWENKYSK